MKGGGQWEGFPRGVWVRNWGLMIGGAGRVVDSGFRGDIWWVERDRDRGCFLLVGNWEETGRVG